MSAQDTFHGIACAPANGRDFNADASGVFDLAEGGRLFVVCDGFGDRDVGDVAANLALFTFGETFRDNSAISMKERFAIAFQETNAILVNEARFQGAPSLAASVIAAWIQGSEVVLGWVGQSRALHLRGASVLHRTEPGMTRSLLPGQASVVEARIQVNISQNRILLEPGDVLIIGTEEGLINLQDWELGGTVGGLRCEEAAQALVAQALRRGLQTDVTFLVVIAGQERCPKATVPRRSIQPATGADNQPPDPFFRLVRTLTPILLMLAILLAGFAVFIQYQTSMTGTEAREAFLRLLPLSGDRKADSPPQAPATPTPPAPGSPALPAPRPPSVQPSR